MRQTLIRLLIIMAIAGITVGGIKLIADRQQQADAKFDLLGQIKKSLQGTGEKVLGEAVKHLPQAPNLDEAVEGEVEPIQAPVDNIQKQTSQLIEDIKSLPQDQLEAVKKQVFKELCSVLKCE